MEQPTRLTFKALNERIDGIPDHPSAVMEPSPKEKYGYATALLAVALCFLAMKVLPDDRWYTVAVAGFFFLVEMMAVVVALLPKWPPRLPGFRADRNEYAEQLDYDFEHYGNLIAWIATHPREQIAALADYAELRQDRFRGWRGEPWASGGWAVEQRPWVVHQGDIHVRYDPTTRLCRAAHAGGQLWRYRPGERSG